MQELRNMTNTDKHVSGTCNQPIMLELADVAVLTSGGQMVEVVHCMTVRVV